MPDRDISQYSDEELQSIIDGGKQSFQPDISSVPTEELERIAGQQRTDQQGDWRGEVAAALRGAREAIPFGQDIGAAATAPFTGRSFAEEKRHQMAQDVGLYEQYPRSYMSGMATGVGAQMLAPEIGLVRAGMGFPAKVAAGSAEGALYGLGQGVTPEERIKGAETGALFGAGATAGLTAAGKGLEAAGAGASRLFRGPQAQAERAIGEALETDIRRGADRLTPQEIDEAVKRGQPILPVDVGGGTLSGELRTATNISPEAEATIYGPLKQRNLEQQARYEHHLQGMMGHDLNAAGMQESLRERAREINRPAYRAAYDAPNAQNIWNEDLARLVNAPAVKSAIQPAMVKAENKAVLGEAPNIDSPFTVDSAGNVSVNAGKPHSLEFWDNVKQAMDDKIGALKRAGDSSWVDINKIKNKLITTLDNSVKDAEGNSLYGKARSGAAMMFGADNAFDAGLSFLGTRSTLNAAKMKKAVESMKPNEREIFAHGVAADMLSRIRNRKERSDISKLFDSPEEREKIAMALGPERTAQFEAFHRVENIMDRAYQAVVSNSTTAKQYLRSQEQSYARKIIGRLPYMGGEAGLAGAYSHSITQAILPVLLDLTGTTVKHVSDRRRLDSIERLGEMLVSPDPAVRQQVMDMIASKPSAMEKLRNIDTSLRRLVTIGGVEPAREQRKSGGKVYPAKRLTLLEKAARKAHGELANGSKPLMNMPDEHIAHQLNMAKDQ